MILKRDKYIYYNYSRRWSKALLKICGVNILLSGIENLDSDSTYIYVANHSSLFDIPISLAGLEHDNIRIMYKKELEKIPIFGWGLAQSPFISVERSDPRNAMASIENAVNSVREGVSVLIFPEGTRSQDGTLGNFKRGAFLLASRSGKQIAPVSIVGSNKILPKKSFYFNPGTVHLIISPPHSTSEDISRADEKLLMAAVHGEIKNNLPE